MTRIFVAFQVRETEAYRGNLRRGHYQVRDNREQRSGPGYGDDCALSRRERGWTEGRYCWRMFHLAAKIDDASVETNGEHDEPRLSLHRGELEEVSEENSITEYTKVNESWEHFVRFMENCLSLCRDKLVRSQNPKGADRSDQHAIRDAIIPEADLGGSSRRRGVPEDPGTIRYFTWAFKCSRFHC